MLPSDWTDAKIGPRKYKKSSQHISNSAQKIKPRDLSSEILKSYKRKSALEIHSKSTDRYNRSSSEQDTEQQHYNIRKSKNYGYVSHLFNILRRQTNHPKQENEQKSQDKSTAAELKQQLVNLSTNANQMAPSKIRTSTKSIKKRMALSSLSKQKTEPTKTSTPGSQEVTAKQLKDYSKYIHSKTIYSTQVNYSALRNLQKMEAFSKIDIKQYKIIQSVVLCLIDSLTGNQPSTQNLIIEYSGLYFQNQQRKKFEIAVNHYIFKSFSPKIKSSYAYTRLWFYLISLSAEYKILFSQGVPEVVLIGCKLIDRLLKSLYDAVSQALIKGSASVLEAFRSLKTVKDIQKIVIQFDIVLMRLQKMMSKQSQSALACNLGFHEQFSEILTNIKPFLLESSYCQQEEYLYRAQIILSWKYLGIPPTPFLPQKPKHSKKYTLVIGLNKVIILYNSTTRVLKYRPYMDTFLTKMKQYYQVIVFSDFDKELTDRIVKQIEKDQVFFSARLYRTHMIFKNGRIIKDLSKLGRSISETILMDTELPFLGDFPDNQFTIPEFKQSALSSNSVAKDKTLLTSSNKLQKMSSQYPEDIRKLLKRSAQLYHIPEAKTIQQNSISYSHNREQQYHQ